MKTSYLEIKKSKFYSFMYSVSSKETVLQILDQIKKDHKNAKHIVYAYKIGSLEKLYSDKEPSGTCIGLLDTIKRNNLDNTLIVVVRYFGGTLLGVGPLTRSYSKVANDLTK